MNEWRRPGSRAASRMSTPTLSIIVPAWNEEKYIGRTIDSLRRAGYAGDFILQTARASNHDHAGTLCRYRDLVRSWWSKSESRA